jgi:hypothetical protein
MHALDKSKNMKLTVCLEAGFFEHRLFGLFDNGTLEAGIVDQRTTT